MYQTLMFAMNLGLVANNIGLMWVAVELATLTTVLMVGIYRTHEALEAAWKYFILGSVGIALALFGTILVYMAARPVIGEGADAMVWTTLIKNASSFSPELLNVAFRLSAARLWHQVGLAPLHAWLPDAHAEGPTPISAGAVGAPAQRRTLRAAALQDAARGELSALASGPLMVTLGLVSVVFAAFMLYRRATSSACSPIRRSSTWASSCSPSAWAADRQFCRAVAHGDAQPDEVGDLLCGRSHRTDQRHAEDRRDGWTH